MSNEGNQQQIQAGFPEPGQAPVDAASEARSYFENKRERRDNAKPLNPATLRRRRQQRQAGFEFTLENTLDDEGYPTVIRARLPELFDAQSLASLPAGLRKSIFDVVDAVEAAERSGGLEAADMSTKDIVETFGNLAELANSYCIIGFISPRCYATEEEADEKGGVAVGDIDIRDRIEFFSHCSRMEAGASASVAPFPDSGQVPAMGDRSTGTPVPGAG